MTQDPLAEMKKAWVAQSVSRVQAFIKAGVNVEAALTMALSTQADILALEVRDFILQTLARNNQNNTRSSE